MISFTGTVDKIKTRLFELKKDKLYDVEIREHREKRSLNANSYMWKLVSEIAEAINRDKDYVYFVMLTRYGKSDLFAVKRGVKPENYFRYYEVDSKTDTHIWYRIYKGSSQYNKHEMQVFLQGIVEECKEMGLPIKEDWELEEMIKEWESEYC